MATCIKCGKKGNIAGNICKSCRVLNKIENMENVKCDILKLKDIKEDEILVIEVEPPIRSEVVEFFNKLVKDKFFGENTKVIMIPAGVKISSKNIKDLILIEDDKSE